MFESLSFASTAIFPILLLALLGYLLKHFNVLSEAFFASAHKLVFHAALPCLIFVQIYQMDVHDAPDSVFLLFCVLGMCICYALATVGCALFIKDRAKAGAFAQGMTRSTFSIVGLPLAEGLFGSAGLIGASILLPPIVIINNAFAVIMLTVLSPQKREQKAGKTFVSVVKSIITNPLIIGMLLALVVRGIGITLPTVIFDTVNSFSVIAQPLAVLCLGAGFVKGTLRGRIRMAVVASVFKTVVLPLIFVCAAYLFGFRETELGLVCILFGGPTTISSYIMAKSMGSDETLTGQIVLLSTVMSIFTLFLLFFSLHTLQLV